MNVKIIVLQRDKKNFSFAIFPIGRNLSGVGCQIKYFRCVITCFYCIALFSRGELFAR